MTVAGVDILLFGLIGLLAGAHCIGMCGPLVTVYTAQMREASAARDAAFLNPYQVRQHALFNVGRAASYTVIGALLGGIGGIVFVGIGRFAFTGALIRGGVGSIIGGGIMLIGAYYLAGRTGWSLKVPGSDRIWTLLHTRIERWVNGFGIVGLGALHGILPCPVLYPAYLFAFATGSPLAGGIALAALGLGTIPAVFLFGTVLGDVKVTHRVRIHRVLGLAFIVLGYVLFAHGLADLGVYVPHPELPFWDPLGHPGHEHH